MSPNQTPDDQQNTVMQPTMMTPPPMQDTAPPAPGLYTPPQPQSPPPRRNKVTLIIALISLLLISGSLALYFIATKQDGGKQASRAQYDSIKAVTPSETIRVGEYHYADPCRVLPIAEVEKNLKVLEDAGSYSEVFYAQTPPKKDGKAASIKSECRYSFMDKDVSYLKLEIEQFSSADGPKKRWDTIRQLGNGEFRKRALTKTPTPADGDTMFDEQIKTFESLYDEQDIAELEAKDGGAPLSTLDPTVLYVQGRGSLVTYQDNKLLTLTYTYGGASSFDGSAKMDRQEAEAHSATMNKLFAVIRKNSTDRSLSQAPQTSIPSGKKEVYGAKVIEPCALLTNKLFQDSVGKAASARVETDSTSKSLTRTTKNAYGRILYPLSSCRRETALDTTDSGTEGSMTVELIYTPSPEKAKEYVDQEIDNLFKRDLDMTKSLQELDIDNVVSLPQSAADKTYIFDTTRDPQISSSIGSPMKYSYSAVGSYVFVIRASLEDGSTKDKRVLTDEKQLKLISEMTKIIRSIK